jgi:CRP-like cAMP-binding protein
MKGDNNKGVFFVRRGKVKIYQNSRPGQERIVYIYGKGDHFGYGPVFEDNSHSFSAIAMDNTVVTFVKGEAFMKLINGSPLLAKKLLADLSRELSVWIHKMTIFATYGIKERLSLSLLLLSKTYSVPGALNKQPTIAINHKDLADFAGADEETIVKILGSFEEKGIISMKGAKFTVLKPKILFGFLNKLLSDKQPL